MNFKQPYEIRNKHAFFSPSKHTWLKWDRDIIAESWKNAKAAEIGTLIHGYAEDSINLGNKLLDKKSTLGMYVNDCIDYKMDTEVPLYYNDLCFGHADALAFRRKKLRIFDLKTGLVTPGSMEQLLIYAALFCFNKPEKYRNPGDLDWSWRFTGLATDPHSISYDLRIYQFDQAICYEPSGDEIAEIMTIIVENTDFIMNELFSEEEIR